MKPQTRIATIGNKMTDTMQFQCGGCVVYVEPIGVDPRTLATVWQVRVEEQCHYDSVETEIMAEGEPLEIAQWGLRQILRENGRGADAYEHILTHLDWSGEQAPWHGPLTPM